MSSKSGSAVNKMQKATRDFSSIQKKCLQRLHDLVDRPFLRFSDMLKVTPDLMKLRAERSVYKTVSKYVKDEHLRQAMSFHSLLVGGNPFQTSSIYTLIHFLERQWGVFFPRGGTHALVRALVKLFEELGGEIRLNSPVKRPSCQQWHSTKSPGRRNTDF